MGRGTQQHRTPEPVTQPDPLADLRTDPVPGISPELMQAEPGEDGPVTIRPMVDQDTQDDMVAEVVAAWHADPTSQGFLHGGGQCGCRYIARQALQAAVPVMTEEDLKERELEPQP